MHPTLVREPFHREGWVFEEKYDGWRMIAYKDGERVRLVAKRPRSRGPLPRYREKQLSPIGVKEFFESVPPGRPALVTDPTHWMNNILCLKLPWIQLHCDSGPCEGVRFFAPQNRVVATEKQANGAHRGHADASGPSRGRRPHV